MYVFVLTALARSTQIDWLHAPLNQGHIRLAAVLAQEFLDDHVRSDDDDHTAEVAILCGDLMLAQDRDEDAEECYRRAVKSAALGARGVVRVLACRATGFMSLYQQRFGTAVSCLRRIVEDDASSEAQKVEAYCGQALAHNGMGQIPQAMTCLERAAELAETCDDPYLVMLPSIVRTDLLVQQEIRTHHELQDHVFWQMPIHTATTAEAQLHALPAVDACLVAYENYPLVVNRLRHLRGLILVTCGDYASLQRAQEHLAWLRQSQFAAGERQARMEMALVAIVVRNAEVARNMIEPLTARISAGAAQRWNFELSYCQSKIFAMSGRADEALKHYQRYALESVQCVRTETINQQVNVDVHPNERVAVIKDDVEMSLPAKYRRAYRYLMEHLDCVTLSVREIAEDMGVTERALQTVFKEHLGMTPAEVVRRARVERIRQDLLQGDLVSMTVLETAARWGIRNRSTLVSLYRRYFRETPAETLARSGRVALDQADFADVTV
jgi:AraC-like DNA-binding protein